MADTDAALNDRLRYLRFCDAWRCIGWWAANPWWP